VLSYFPASTPTQFIQNPDEIDWKKEKWQVWFQTGHPQEYLKTLHALIDHQAYIVFSTSDYTLEITGTPWHTNTSMAARCIQSYGFLC
jgi:hypothetical protein